MIGLGAAVLGSAAISGASNYLGGRAMSSAAQAARADAQGYRANVNRTARRAFGPYMETGRLANEQLNRLFLDPDGTDISPFIETPGYQFTRDQGEKALLRNQSALGRLNSGETMMGLSEFNQGLASTGFENYVNRLLQLSGGGQAASGALVGTMAGGAGAGMGALPYQLAGQDQQYSAFGNAANNAIGNLVFADLASGGDFFGGGQGNVSSSSYATNRFMGMPTFGGFN